ncbi:hypothetical protein ACFL54_08935 [Planctomycetota bacterium]
MSKLSRVLVICMFSTFLCCVVCACGGTSGGGGSTAPTVTIGGGDQAGDVTVVIGDLPDIDGGAVSIPFTLYSEKSFQTSIIPQYSINGGNWQYATAHSTSGPTSRLRARPQGSYYSFVWDSYQDGIALDGAQNNMRFRIIPLAGTSTTSEAFTVDNEVETQFNSPAAASTQGGTGIAVTFVLTSDYNMERLTLVAEYSTDGGLNYSTATVTGNLANLRASPAGVNCNVSWDSVTDKVGMDAVANVLFRLRTVDSEYIYAPLAFTVDNVINITFLSPLNGARVGGSDQSISFGLQSTFGLTVDVIIRFKEFGGSYQNISLTATSPGLADLDAPATGQVYTVNWDSYSDEVGITGDVAVELNIAVATATPATRDVTANNKVSIDIKSPSVLVPLGGPAQLFSFEITSEFAISGEDVRFQYDDGSGYEDCTASDTYVNPLTALDTNGGAINFGWDTWTEEVNFDVAGDVDIRAVVASNGEIDELTYEVDNVVTLEIIRPPTPADQIPGGVGANVTNRIRLTSNITFASLLDVTFQYSVDGGTVFTDCQLAVGSAAVTGLSSNSVGINYDLIWDSFGQDIGTDGTQANVVVRIQLDLNEETVSSTWDVTNVIEIDVPDVPASPVGGRSVALSYTLTSVGDISGVDVRLEYSVDGLLYQLASAAPLTGNSGAGGVVNNIIWDTLADSVGVADPEANVTFRATVVSGGGLDLDTDLNSAFTVNNRIVVTVETPAGDQQGTQALITYQLTHPVVGAVATGLTVQAFYALDSVVYLSATQGAGGDALTNRNANGGDNTFSWNTVADNVAMSAAENDVNFKIMVNTGNHEGICSDFTVDNTQLPQPEITDVIVLEGLGWTNVIVEYEVTDTDAGPGDTVNVTLEFSTDGGIVFSSCQENDIAYEGFTSEGTANITVNEPHYFMWDSLGNGAGITDDVITVLQITVLESSFSDLSDQFWIDNTFRGKTLDNSVPGSNMHMAQNTLFASGEYKQLYAVYMTTGIINSNDKIIFVPSNDPAGGDANPNIFDGTETTLTIFDVEVDTDVEDTIWPRAFDAVYDAANEFYHVAFVMHDDSEDTNEVYYIKVDVTNGGVIAEGPVWLDAAFSENEFNQQDDGDYDTEANITIVLDLDGSPIIFYYDSDDENLNMISSGFDGSFAATGDNKLDIVYPEPPLAGDTSGICSAAVVTTEDSGGAPVAKGNIHLLFSNKNNTNIYAGEFNINADLTLTKRRLGPPGGSWSPEARPSMLVDIDTTTIHVVYSDSNDSQIRYLTSGPDGILFGGGDDDDFLVATVTTENCRPQVGVDRQNNIFVAYGTGDPAGSQIQFAYTGPDGEFGTADDRLWGIGGIDIPDQVFPRIGFVFDALDADPGANGDTDLPRDWMHVLFQRGDFNTLVFYTHKEYD